MISRVRHTTHALPTPRAWASNVMLVSGANLALIVVYLCITPRPKEMGFEVHEQVSVASVLYPQVNFCEHCTDRESPERW